MKLITVVFLMTFTSAAISQSTSISVTRPATYSDIVGLFGSGSCSGFLKSDGTCATAGGSGTVTHTAGPLTAKQLMIGNGAADATIDPNASTDGAGNLTVVSQKTTGVAGVGGGNSYTEGTATAGSSGTDIIWADSTSHRLKANNNNGGAVNLLTSIDVIPTSEGGTNTASPAFASQTDSSSVTWAIGSALIANASLTMAHTTSTRAINLTGLVNGGSYVVILKQDSTGGAAATLGTGCTWFQGGSSGFTALTTLALTTTASAINILAFTYDGTNCYGNLR
jgi:hypothetical protein